MSDNKKKAVSIRLSEQEKQELERRSEQVRMNVSEYCRQLLLECQLTDNVDKQRLASIACMMYTFAERATTIGEIQQVMKGAAREIWLLIK